MNNSPKTGMKVVILGRLAAHNYQIMITLSHKICWTAFPQRMTNAERYLRLSLLTTTCEKLELRDISIIIDQWRNSRGDGFQIFQTCIRRKIWSERDMNYEIIHIQAVERETSTCNWAGFYFAKKSFHQLKGSSMREKKQTSLNNEEWLTPA